MTVTVSILGLDLLHWLFIIILPLAALIVSSVARANGGRRSADLCNRLDELKRELNTITDCSMNNVDSVRAAYTNSGIESLEAAFDHAVGRSATQYAGRWLPDLRTAFTPDRIFPANVAAITSDKPFFIAQLLNLISSLGFVLLLLHPLTAPASTTNSTAYPYLLVLPILSAIMVGALSKNKTQNITRIQTHLEILASITADVVPVYTDNAGVALLVDRMLDHEAAMQTGIDDLNRIVSDVVKGEFAKGINESIHSVMREEVVPPIEQAASVLADLATNLTEKQQAGMADLSREFSANVADILHEYLLPVGEQLHSSKMSRKQHPMRCRRRFTF